MTTKDRLHQLVDRLDAEDLEMVERLLERLTESADLPLSTLETAPPDDEPETPGERAAVAAARADVQAGRVVSHDAIKQEFGV